MSLACKAAIRSSSLVSHSLSHSLPQFYYTTATAIAIATVATAKAMEFIHKVLNLVLPPMGFTALLFFLPSFLFFRFLLYILRSLLSEDVAGKVVLITGASSGIGEHLAYQYATRGACLVLVARREKSLQEVADTARRLGSPEVLVIRADVSKVEDCKSFVGQAVEHFGRLDHLVNNAGIAPAWMFEDSTDVTNFPQDINFWGSVYSTHSAIPHLRRTKGRIIVIASSGGWLSAPRISLYCASKAAMISLYETLRIEFGTKVGVTIVTPGLIESEITQGKFLSKEGLMKLDQELRDVQMSAIPVESVERCANAIVNSACRGDTYLTEPPWMKVTLYWKAFCPEILDWCSRLLLLTKPGIPEREAPSMKILELTGARKFLYPPSIRSPQLKVD